MPKARPKKKEPRQSGAPKPPVVAVRDAADALFRAASECCHQHDRVSRVHQKSDVEDEIAAGVRACEHCDTVLSTMTQAYEDAAANVKPDGGDEKWWRQANALWLASREYLRRHGAIEQAMRESREHGPDSLGKLQTEYELEASALLGLRHAAEAYKRERPAAA